MRRIGLLLALFLLNGCACGTAVDSDAEARIAYLGVDGIVSRTLALGFAGFNAADSANIPAQTDDGDEEGTITIGGQVDQGASDNKGMRLDVALVEYLDGPIDDPETEEEEEFLIVYDTAEAEPLAVDLSLRNIPDGTLEGTLIGRVIMTGDLEGGLDLSLTFTGEIEEDEDNPGDTLRSPGTTTVIGTATNDGGGVFAIDTEI
jgi:hypothetical protein